MTALEQFADNIWIADGPPVDFHGFDYSVRMTVIRLTTGPRGDEIFIHSPISPTPEILQEVVALGDVAYIVSHNKIHHLYLGDWGDIFPEAQVFASPGLMNKRPELSFDGELGDAPETGWSKEIDQLIFAGSRAMDEVVFFHKPSQTLILADLIENFDRDWFKGWRRWIAGLAGIIAPKGKAPLDFRLSFFGRKAAARKSFARIIGWQPKHIIIAHGHCFKNNAMDELKRAFSWLS